MPYILNGEVFYNCSANFNSILMQRKVIGGSVSFNRNWVPYRDGFGSATGNDNYWLGLDKVYRLVQLDSARLRVEV